MMPFEQWYSIAGPIMWGTVFALAGLGTWGFVHKWPLFRLVVRLSAVLVVGVVLVLLIEFWDRGAEALPLLGFALVVMVGWLIGALALARRVDSRQGGRE